MLYLSFVAYFISNALHYDIVLNKLNTSYMLYIYICADTSKVNGQLSTIHLMFSLNAKKNLTKVMANYCYNISNSFLQQVLDTISVIKTYNLHTSQKHFPAAMCP